MMSTTTLTNQLTQISESMHKNMPADQVKRMDDTKSSFESTFTPSAPEVGAQAPLFSLPNANGDSIRVSELLKQYNFVILTWYRGSWCPYCNVALRALTVANEEFKKLGAKLVCMTPETPDESLTVREKHDLSFQVLTDNNLQVAEKYGVAFTIDDNTKQFYSSLGIHFDQINGNNNQRKPKLPLPAVFVLDKTGKIVYRFVNVDYTKRAEPADIITAIKSLQA